MTQQMQIGRHSTHCGWDNELPPAIVVNLGDEVELDMVDAGGGQLGPESSTDDVAALSFEGINPVTGPVYVNGVSPSDTLAVEILGFEGSGWGWTAIIPGFGLLSDEFTQPFLVVSKYNEDWVEYTPGIRLPYRPFPGTIGVAPAEKGVRSIVFPGSGGGNMDIRNLTAGSKLFLPVQVEGALFSAGDGHAAQGDGEVCGTAVETDLKLRVRFGVEKATAIPYPRFEAVEAPYSATSRCYVTMGVGPDLMAASRDAVRYMIDYLSKEYDLEPQLAYTLCSVAADLRISEIVDAPNWIVTLHLDKSVFI